MKRIHYLGFSMIELMVALTIGLLILVGVVQVFIGNRGNFRSQNGYAVMQESGVYLTEYLSRFIRMAGYRTPPATGSVSGFTPLSTFFTVASPYITAASNTGLNGSDSLTISYQGSGNGTGTPDGLVVDCLNAGVDANKLATLTFSISNNRTLQCNSVNATTGTSLTADVLDNVENFQVLMGEDTDSDGIANRFVTPNYGGLNLQNVVAVRISAMLTSDDGDSPALNSNSYNLLGTLYTPTPDHRLRLLVTTTIQLRNRLPGSSN